MKQYVPCIRTGNDIMVPGFKSEDQLNAFCFQWAYGTYPEYRGLLFHVANEVQVGGMHGMRLRSRNKAVGVIAGIPDFVFMYGQGFGLEGKLEMSITSPVQDAIHKAWVAAGRVVFIFNSFEKFMLAFHMCISEDKIKPQVFQL